MPSDNSQRMLTTPAGTEIGVADAITEGAEHCFVRGPLAPSARAAHISGVPEFSLLHNGPANR